MKKTSKMLRKSLVAALIGVSSVSLAIAVAGCTDSGNKPNGDDNQTALTSGTYWTEKSVEVAAMNTSFDYVVHMTLDAEANTYYYECHYVADMGTAATYYMTETGSYTDDGETLVFQPAGAEESGYITATISEDGFTLTRTLAGRGNKYEVTFEKGEAPTYITYTVDGTEYAKIGYKQATDEVTGISAEIYGCEFVGWENLPATAAQAATATAKYTDGDVYAVDVSWMTSMGATMSMSPVLVINGKKFGIYNGSDRGACKGWGTVAEADGVYTLTYTDTDKYANHTTTTYTLSGNTITFTSKLFYGAASLNYTDDDGEFVSYTATLSGATDEEEDGEENAEGLASGNYSVDISWSQMAGFMTPVLVIDAENNMLGIYNGADRETSKAAGTISCEDGVYTLTYTDGEQYATHEGQTTTFTYDAASKTITFTSKIFYGAASFNRTVSEDDDTFVTYTAELVEAE